VRIGLVLAHGDEGRQAALADAHGLFGVLVDGGVAGAESVSAAEAVVASEALRVALRLRLGHEHPVTLAEEIAVLDNAANGRLVVLADTGDLDEDAAAEDVALLRRCWASRPVRHRGARWHVPAGIAGHDAPGEVEVTPKPAQVDIPVWLRGPAAPAVARRQGLPVVAEAMDTCDADLLVQPAIGALTGDLEQDRASVLSWAVAGATHLFVRLPAGTDPGEALGPVSRFLAPEVAMPSFPRIIAESALPAAWPHAEGE
jgi:hypothetical protein